MEQLLEFTVNHLFLSSLFTAITLLLLWNIFSGLAGAAEISSAEMTRLINREDAVILDLRSNDEFKQGHIINAINITQPTEIEQVLKKHKDRVITICCQQGLESMRMVRSLKAKKTTNLYCLKGGVSAWKNDNLPLSKGNTTNKLIKGNTTDK